MANQADVPLTTHHSKLMEATVVSHEIPCRDHRRLTLLLPCLDDAHPGQFLYIGQPPNDESSRSRPFLRRAFSIGGLRSRGGQSETDIIYRIHGSGTRWMASLRSGDRVSVLGPLGHGFEIVSSKPNAWLVAGGVGLPPMLWLAERLHDAGKTTVAFVGARTRELVPLKMADVHNLSRSDASPVFAAEEFNQIDTPIVPATDDGTLGFEGTVCQALATYHGVWDGDAAGVVVYCCGPEAMMAAVSDWCADHEIECYVCLERAMACGMGTCQSCVVRVRDPADEEGWSYALCCSQGPVFDARDVIWD